MKSSVVLLGFNSHHTAKSILGVIIHAAKLTPGDKQFHEVGETCSEKSFATLVQLGLRFPLMLTPGLLPHGKHASLVGINILPSMTSSCSTSLTTPPGYLLAMCCSKVEMTSSSVSPLARIEELAKTSNEEKANPSTYTQLSIVRSLSPILGLSTISEQLPNSSIGKMAPPICTKTFKLNTGMLPTPRQRETN